MAELLKNVYTEKFITQLLYSWKKVLPNLNSNEFKQFVFSNNWEKLELKERMSRIANAMELALPKDFEKAAPQLIKMIDVLEKDNFPVNGFEYMFIPEYVERNGLQSPEISFKLLERITQFVSCEFAIRPFIMKYEKKSMDKMLKWSEHPHPNVRRFSSEGCRSRLPWGMALPRFKKDASLILPILENLKADTSLFVRKSVANNLNDISKDHPELANEIAQRWYGKKDTTNWIVKHGCRTLLKAGNPKVMQLFGYAPINQLTVTEPTIETSIVEFGKHLNFKFTVKNKTDKELLIRLEYAIYFLKNNGTQSKKVFKISERSIKKKEKISISKSHPIKAISTRKYYAGEHELSIIVNGIELKKHSFLLNM